MKTVFALALLILAATGCQESEVTPAERGASLAEEKGCVSCHSADGTKSVGPTWKGLYGSRVELEDGSTAVADEEYLEESMLEPSAKTVKGFGHGVMESVIKRQSLTDREVADLIAYIKSL